VKSERRHHDRILIPDDKLLDCEGISRPLAGKISVLGPGGMFVRTRDTYPSGTELELRIRAGADTLEAACVVRDAVPGGLGVEFTWLRGPLEEKLKRIMARLKP